MCRIAWTCIAILLSGLWLYGATVYQGSQEVDLRTGVGWQEASAILACLDKNRERRARDDTEPRCGTDREPQRAQQDLQAAPPIYYATIVAGIWLAMAWVVGWAVFAAACWFLDWD